MAEFNEQNRDYIPLADQIKQRPGWWSPTITGGMLAQLRNLTGAIWSPDGNYLYFGQDFDGRSDIFRLDVNSNQLLQLTAEMEASPLPMLGQGGTTPAEMTLSPDGNSLIYVGGKDGKLWVMPSKGGVIKRLVEGEGAQINPSFSPDGKQVAFVWGDNEKQAIAVTDSNGEGWARKISKGNAFPFAPRWLPDSSGLIYQEYDSRGAFFRESRLVLADLASGSLRVLREGFGKSIAFGFFGDYNISPDGKWLAYVSDESGWANLYLLDLKTGQSKLVSGGGAEHSYPVWSPDSTKLVYSVNRNANLNLMLSTLEGQTYPVEEGDFICGCPSWSPDGTRLSYVKQSPVLPPNLYVYNLNQKQAAQLTTNTVGGLESETMVDVDQVKWKSPDGLEIEGLMLKPKNIQKGKHPLLLYVHGGPIGQYTRRWEGSAQYWVNRGWIVLQPNFRGSTGYGRKFRESLLSTWGQEDMLDNVGGIDFLQEQGLIDSSRVVSWGGSGGGYATFMLLTKWSERFKAGVALVAVSNLITLADTTDRPARYLVDNLLGLRVDNSALHIERSPVNFAHLNKSPLLILMGEVDKRVPPSQGEEMVEALKKVGRTDFEYHVYPGEAHGWRKSETIRDYHTRMEKFLQKWVLER
jgi:dipeptidyl aminopeptidase/acylaminoacyl peptidase